MLDQWLGGTLWNIETFDDDLAIGILEGPTNEAANTCRVCTFLTLTRPDQTRPDQTPLSDDGGAAL